MTLQMSIEQIHDVDAQQDLNHEKLAEEVLLLESKVEGHESKIEEHEKLFLEPADALIELKLALEIEPKYADALESMGRIYFERNDFKRAVAQYQLALDADPSRLTVRGPRPHAMVRGAFSCRSSPTSAVTIWARPSRAFIPKTASPRAPG